MDLNSVRFLFLYYTIGHLSLISFSLLNSKVLLSHTASVKFKNFENYNETVYDDEKVLLCRF